MSFITAKRCSSNKLGLWLFPGGHIEKDETPDDAVLREIREEVSVSVRLVQKEHALAHGEIKALAMPFYVNLHSVGDHNHVGFYYLCAVSHGAPGDDVQINDESLGFRWLTEEEIQQDSTINPDIKRIARMGFESYRDFR